MKNYMLTTSYDGSRYNGWQRQKSSDNTIQGKIENVLSLMALRRVEINGSGRTDAGVHALGQTANFKLDTETDKSEILDYLNKYLPDDIAVLRIDEVPERFHCRLCARSKTYMYRIQNSPVSNVFERKYMYKYPDKLDIDKMRLAADAMLGKRDFLGLSTLKKSKKSTVRTVFGIDVERLGDEIRIYYRADGFLYNMVRIMTGTLIEAGTGIKSWEDIERVFETGNREYAGFTAPARGLTLVGVEYSGEYEKYGSLADGEVR